MGCSPSSDGQTTRTSKTTGHRLYPHGNRNFPDGDPNKGSLKKRIRREMTNRIKSGTQAELEETLRRCEEFRLPADELYFRAVRKVEYLTMRNALKDAVRRRHYSTLRDAISKVERSQYASDLSNSLQSARSLLSRLSHQWDGEPVRLTMGYSAVSEVRRFKSPPGSVVDSVKACFLLIGTPLWKVKSWPMMRGLLCRTGRDSILIGMTRYDPNQVSITSYKMADSLIRKWEEREVSTVSLEAATFWAWANSALNRKYNQLHSKPKK